MREAEATSPQTGTVDWDTRMILTRHRSTLADPCAKVAAIRDTPGSSLVQLQAGHEALCTCGAEEAEWERTIYREHA